MKTKRSKFAIVAMLIAAGTFANIAPASATHKNQVCDAGDVCWFDWNNHGGRLYDNNNGVDGNLSNNDYPAGGGTNNTFNFVDNRAGGASYLVQLFAGFNMAEDNLSGGGNCIGNHVWSFENFGTANRGSSHRPRSDAQCIS